ncbi:hypothetical protein HDU89_003656 [Geranomyces variabilis]|nr:hypothetical protein HDU89_003656 [Geranomyces variabilis]
MRTLVRELSHEDRGSQRYLRGGWGPRGLKIYDDTYTAIRANSISEVVFPVGGLKAKVAPVLVVSNWWTTVASGQWEINTFLVYRKYIDAETVLVDFGTWVGPTVLFGAQLATKVIGIEGDPAAFAAVEYNIKANAGQEWSKRISLYANCVSDSESVVEMSSPQPGNSGSQIGGNSTDVGWTSQCYPLETILDAAGGIGPFTKLFIKIDVEGHECIIFPALEKFIQKMNVKPTFYLSLHSALNKCTQAQYEKIKEILATYPVWGAVADDGTVSQGEFSDNGRAMLATTDQLRV